MKQEYRVETVNAKKSKFVEVLLQASGNWTMKWNKFTEREDSKFELVEKFQGYEENKHHFKLQVSELWNETCLQKGTGLTLKNSKYRCRKKENLQYCMLKVCEQ